MSWEAVIGLEIHARLKTVTKLFCACPTAFGASPNTNVCPICLGYPGALPVMNHAAVDLALRMALATGCAIHDSSIFARKNYFYPDLPKGYQISQFDRPVATGGSIRIGERRIRIQRIHIEEDAGKLLHRENESLVDLNRAGTPLIEIVSEPDIRSAEEAASYFTRVRQVLMYTEVCDGNMEEGSLRCDANVSIHRPSEPFGTRSEVKNLNSFRFLSKAIEFEIGRQIETLERGDTIVQETRLFDPATGETRPMRSKEEAHDYRYFPEPDLLTLRLGPAAIETARAALPELPDARSARYHRDWQIPQLEAEALAATRELADFFEAVAEASGQPRAAANWVRNEVLRILNEQRLTLHEYRVDASMLARLIVLVEAGTIGGKAAKEVFDEISATGESPDSVVERRGLQQVSDRGFILTAARRVVEASPQQLAQYRAGKKQLFGFFIGQVMKATSGKANAEMTNEIMRRLLDAAE